MNPTVHSWVEISKSATIHNIHMYKNIIGANKSLALVVKSNAYGHGMLEIASIADPIIDWFCVAQLSDALLLRQKGIIKPILVLSCIDADPVDAINNNISFIISDLQTGEYLNSCAQKQNAKIPVHIKIDTGLSRLGILPSAFATFYDNIKQLKYLAIEGICSHFAESNSKDLSFTYAQLEQFNTLLKQNQKEICTIRYKHFSNSAATTTLDLDECNFFRVGVGIYGLWPSPINKERTLAKYPGFSLQPVLTWKSRLIGKKEISANTAVGYDRTFTTTRQTTLGFLPVGYYDGYDFRLHNNAVVKINNRYAPVIGRVSMNLMTIDITDIPAIIGDEIIIMGKDESISPYTLGLAAGIPNVREMTTKINSNIKRIIVE